MLEQNCCEYNIHLYLVTPPYLLDDYGQMTIFTPPALVEEGIIWHATSLLLDLGRLKAGYTAPQNLRCLVTPMILMSFELKFEFKEEEGKMKNIELTTK